jgi:hypothetical protein
MNENLGFIIPEIAERGIPDCCGDMIKICLEKRTTSALIGCEECGTFWWIFQLESVTVDQPESDLESDDIKTGFMQLNNGFYLKKVKGKNIVRWVKSHKFFYAN